MNIDFYFTANFNTSSLLLYDQWADLNMENKNRAQLVGPISVACNKDTGRHHLSVWMWRTGVHRPQTDGLLSSSKPTILWEKNEKTANIQT